MSSCQLQNSEGELAQAPRRRIEGLGFEHSFLNELPGDPDPRNRPRQVEGACYSRVAPTPVSAPRLLALSQELLSSLELDPEPPGPLADVLAGNRLLPGMAPYAACYGGHQFGQWAGQLGDGRAIALGEVRNARGERFELQLKGAGPTPYSRGADGRAVLRSSIREFLCSEAMHALGVPTTRALSLVTTGDEVVRDMFYDGRPRAEPGAIVCRVAPSFLRFGSYQLPASRGDHHTLRALVDYTVRHFFPDLGAPGPETYVRLFEEVCRRTGLLVAHWMRVGFVHGVLNTDNMSVLGLTLDYGPYGWVDEVDPTFTPNTTDAHGRRYCFGRQPAMAAWNLARFGEALLPLIGDAGPLQAGLQTYAEVFARAHRASRLRKLGLGSDRGDEDDALLTELDQVLLRAETDMTLFYRRLALLEPGAHTEGAGDAPLISPLLPAYYGADDGLPPDVAASIAHFLRRYLARVREDDHTPEARRACMRAESPKYVLRNYLAQQAIERAEQGDPAGVLSLHELLRRPYDEQPEYDAYAARRPEWARHRAGCSMLSCSS